MNHVLNHVLLVAGHVTSQAPHVRMTLEIGYVINKICLSLVKRIFALKDGQIQASIQYLKDIYILE